jgi:hypothetical protein
MTQPTEAYYDLVNELLAGADARGGYNMGLVSVMAWRMDLEPDRQLLTHAARTSGHRGCAVIFEAWRKSLTCKELPTVAELTGGDPDFTGELSTEEYIRSIRRG